MPRAAFVRAEPDARRNALIAAATTCLARNGAAGTSVRAICAEAGVSPGLLRHYFAGVDALIAETYRQIVATVATQLAAAAIAAGPEPRARLIAYVTASFRMPIADPALLATWIAFWSLVKTDPAIAAIHSESYAASRCALEALLAENGLADTRPAAIALTALVDGLWLELTLDPGTFTPDDASAMAVHWLDSLLAAQIAQH